MPEFVYTARTAEGHDRSGMLVSSGASDVVSDLRGRGWIVLDVAPAKDEADDFEGARRWFNPVAWLPATRFDVEIGMQQLASMIRSGLTLLTSLKTAAEQARRPRMARIWIRIYRRIEEGSSFADAMASEGRTFPPLVVQLTRVGESSGILETVLESSAAHLERSRSLRTMLVTAMVYPVIVLVAAIVVTAIMVFGVLPRLEKFIKMNSHGKLPAITRTLMDTTHWINDNLITILLTIAAILTTLAIMHRVRATRLWMDAVLLRIPIFGGLLRLAGTAGFSRGLSLMLANGINLLDARPIANGLLSNQAMRRRIDLARESVLEGGPLAEGILAGREFLPMLGRMTAVGEATGNLDTVLGEVARFHELQLAGAVRRFSLLVEPVVILVVGGIVGFVYIAFFVALFSVAGGGR